MLIWNGDIKVQGFQMAMNRAIHDFVEQGTRWLRSSVQQKVPLGARRMVPTKNGMGAQFDPSRPHLRNLLGEANQITVQSSGVNRAWGGVGYIPALDQLVGTYRRAKTGEILTSLVGGTTPKPIWQMLEFGTPAHFIPLRAESPDAPQFLTIWKGGSIYRSKGLKHPGYHGDTIPGQSQFGVRGTVWAIRNRIGKAPFRASAYAWITKATRNFKAIASSSGATMKKYESVSWY